MLSTDSWKLSPDEKTLSVTSSGVKPDGDLYTDAEVYERTAGTSGLVGSWKSSQVKLIERDATRARRAAKSATPYNSS